VIKKQQEPSDYNIKEQKVLNEGDFLLDEELLN
jgi:hypothetical protein